MMNAGDNAKAYRPVGRSRWLKQIDPYNGEEPVSYPRERMEIRRSRLRKPKVQVEMGAISVGKPGRFLGFSANLPSNLNLNRCGGVPLCDSTGTRA